MMPTSIIGPFPTLASATCRHSSRVSSNKFRLIERKDLIDADDATLGKLEPVCFESRSPGVVVTTHGDSLTAD